MNIEVAERQLTVKATPEQTFEALTTREQLRQWFCREIETNLEIGGPFRFWGPRILESTGPEQANQTLLRLEKPHLLQIGWPFEGLASKLTFEVSPQGEGCTVTARHELPGNQEEILCWLAIDSLCVILYNLRNYLENGQVLLQFDLDAGGAAMSSTVTVNAPSEDVWAALTVPEKMDAWVGTGAAVDLREGGEYVYGWGDGPHKILELEEGHRLVTDWTYHDEPKTTAEWVVEGGGGTTQVTISHSGFATNEQTRNYLQGWNAYLGGLKAYVEGRDQVGKTD